MKKLITSAAVVLGLAVAGNAMAQETILNTMTKANNALDCLLYTSPSPRDRG